MEDSSLLSAVSEVLGLHYVLSLLLLSETIAKTDTVAEETSAVEEVIGDLSALKEGKKGRKGSKNWTDHPYLFHLFKTNKMNVSCGNTVGWIFQSLEKSFIGRHWISRRVWIEAPKLDWLGPIEDWPSTDWLQLVFVEQPWLHRVS